MSAFGNVVQALRKADGLTLEAMAKKIRSHKGYVSGIENDKVNPPSVKVLALYQKAFAKRGIRFEDLVELAWVSKAPEVIRERELHRIAATNPLFKITVTPTQIVVPAAMPAKEAV